MAGAESQHIRNRHDGVRFHIWSHAHLPLYLGIPIAGVGIERIIHPGTFSELHTPDAAILGASLGL